MAWMNPNLETYKRIAFLRLEVCCFFCILGTPPSLTPLASTEQMEFTLHTLQQSTVPLRNLLPPTESETRTFQEKPTGCLFQTQKFRSQTCQKPGLRRQMLNKSSKEGPRRSMTMMLKSPLRGKRLTFPNHPMEGLLSPTVEGKVFFALGCDAESTRKCLLAPKKHFPTLHVFRHWLPQSASTNIPRNATRPCESEK